VQATKELLLLQVQAPHQGHLQQEGGTTIQGQVVHTISFLVMMSKEARQMEKEFQT
jgi:hypothetical protein